MALPAHTLLHLWPREVKAYLPDQPEKVCLYSDCPELREVVSEGLHRLVEAHQLTVFANECGRCGNSCRRPEIIVREQEIMNIQQHLGLSEWEFREQYLEPAQATWNPGDGFLKLRDGACPFLEPGFPAIPHSAACQIYSIRPQGCRSFKSDKPFCRKDPGRLVETVLAVQVFEHESRIVLVSGEVHTVPTDPAWWTALGREVMAAEQSDPNKYKNVLQKALEIVATLEADLLREEHRGTLTALEQLFRSAADLSHLQPTLSDRLEDGWIRLQALLARFDRGGELPVEPPVAAVLEPRPEGLEWLYLVEAGLTLQFAGKPAQVFEFRSDQRLGALAWELLQRILRRPEDTVQQSFQELEPSCSMCGECCRFYAVEILPSDIHRLCELLQISPADFVARHTVPPKFGWNRDNRVLLKVPTPLYTKVLRELQVHGQDTPPLEGVQGLQCTFLERRSDGFFYCGVHSHKPKVCADYKATNPLCRKTNQVPNEGRQAHSVQWVYLASDGLRLQTLRGAAAQVDPLFVARGYWPEVEEAALALERAAVASLT